MIIQTDRLTLRPWKETDAESLFRYAKDPEVGPITGWPPHKSVEESLFVIRNVLNGPECYALCEKNSEAAIGSIELMLHGHTGVPTAENECELGFWLGQPFWGRGYVPEAGRELLRRAFTELSMQAVWCCYYDGNTKSKRAQEKLGFRYHHTDSAVNVPLLGEVRTGHTNLMTREDWLSSFTVRPLTAEETPAALDLSWRVFSEFEAPVYAPEGTEEFHRCLSDEKYLNGLVYYGAFDGRHLSAVLGIRKTSCHICFFFTEGKYQRLSLGRRLFERMREDFPDQTITLNSSPYGLPFYKALGFTAAGTEQTVNGIRFTPMILQGKKEYRIVKLCEHRCLKEKAVSWFSSKWSVPAEAYRESIEASFSSVVPSWYLCLEGEKIVAGMGVIENDFHERKDLTPNVCAVYTESFYRNQGIAGRLLHYVCEDMQAQGIDTLYLLTDHVGFYERYGWEFHDMVLGDGEEIKSRMYVHRQKKD